MRNSLVIKGLTKTYANQIKALNNISLELSNGMFGLLGPNGAGKSSFMRTVATLQSADSGSIHYQGHDIARNPHIMRSALGYLPQEFGVYPKTSAFELLDYVATLKGVLDKKQRHKQISSLLEMTNLTSHKDNAVSTYSGGMKQRFGIAQALLGNPQILVIDEPTAGLDPLERNSFHNLLSDIADKMIVILSTHIVEDISNLCPNLAIMSEGSIAYQGSPEQVTEGLTGKLWAKQVSKGDLAKLEPEFELLSARLHRGQYQIRTVSDQRPDDSFAPTKPDLEDAYFHILKTTETQGHAQC